MTQMFGVKMYEERLYGNSTLQEVRERWKSPKKSHLTCADDILSSDMDEEEKRMALGRE